MSGVTSRDDLIQMVTTRDYAGVDALPLDLKLALIGRLVDGLGIDLDHVKGLIWHPTEQAGALPTLTPFHSPRGGLIRDVRSPELSAHEYTEAP